MKRKGFTLIELLAVIVVLAIIALIATPIVMNTIKNAKKGAAERTVDNYIKQVETAVAEAKLENKSVPNGTYNIDGNGNLTGAGLPDGKLEINMSGTKPSGGTVTISNGEVSQKETKLVVGAYEVSYNSSSNKYEAVEKESISPTVVYSRPTFTIKKDNIINPNDTSKFTKDASTLGKNYYLKHILDKDNKVTESYACAILKGKEYCLRGGNSSVYGYAENEADYTGNALILKKLRDAKIAGVSCDFNADRSYCGGGSVNLFANSGGAVSASVDENYCYVTDEGISYYESY